jgi:hypothetical protein
MWKEKFGEVDPVETPIREEWDDLEIDLSGHIYEHPFRYTNHRLVVKGEEV